MTPLLTNRQREALDTIAELCAKGYSPTVREIAGALGVSINAATRHIDTLTDKGHLTRERGKARTIRVVT